MDRVLGIQSKFRLIAGRPFLNCIYEYIAKSRMQFITPTLFRVGSAWCLACNHSEQSRLTTSTEKYCRSFSPLFCELSATVSNREYVDPAALTLSSLVEDEADSGKSR